MKHKIHKAQWLLAASVWQHLNLLKSIQMLLISA
jgi:hypothetical protein